jgi:HrpA-like RNA helicase
MSATMDSELFCSFFQGAPMISVPGRTFPVSNYYLEDLMDATDHIIEEGSRYALRENRYEEKASLWVTTRGGEKRREIVDLVSQVNLNEVTMYPGYKIPTRR